MVEKNFFFFGYPLFFVVMVGRVSIKSIAIIFNDLFLFPNSHPSKSLNYHEKKKSRFYIPGYDFIIFLLWMLNNVARGYMSVNGAWSHMDKNCAEKSNDYDFRGQRVPGKRHENNSIRYLLFLSTLFGQCRGIWVNPPTVCTVSRLAFSHFASSGTRAHIQCAWPPQ